jgi:hypothetical protein
MRYLHSVFDSDTFIKLTKGKPTDFSPALVFICAMRKFILLALVTLLMTSCKNPYLESSLTENVASAEELLNFEHIHMTKGTKYQLRTKFDVQNSKIIFTNTDVNSGEQFLTQVNINDILTSRGVQFADVYSPNVDWTQSFQIRTKTNSINRDAILTMRTPEYEMFFVVPPKDLVEREEFRKELTLRTLAIIEQTKNKI